MNIPWFDSWNDLLKILVCGIVGYLALVLYIRILGKRSTSKMNNFDWIVTVAVGSVYASMVLIKDVAVADGVAAIVVLLGLQFLLTAATARWEWARKLFLSPPSLLYYRGEFMRERMRRERISETEILSAVRESDAGSLENTLAVTLEPDANLSVVAKGANADPKIIEAVRGYEEVASS